MNGWSQVITGVGYNRAYNLATAKQVVHHVYHDKLSKEVIMKLYIETEPEKPMNTPRGKFS